MRWGASDSEFIASYRRWRPIVERSIAWLIAMELNHHSAGWVLT